MSWAAEPRTHVEASDGVRITLLCCGIPSPDVWDDVCNLTAVAELDHAGDLDNGATKKRELGKKFPMEM
ncbi:hypothetical protein DPEC_G00065670 [Dallia pectoralis]|uniref:Uncharacterized protein n=1 Tax=Dallia pectoralis TaxID=75939 RepID=A0ACC2H804_DALPE|nr:hypothetical protein DPEC_G00065670 [Dallia pectoralis]